MTVTQLFEKLGIDPEDEDACIGVYVNGIEKNLKDVPILDFEIESLTLRLENFNTCEVVIYPE